MTTTQTAKRPRRAKETSYWSDDIEGDERSYDRAVTFAITDGYVTIYQRDDEKGITDAVLLSPAQFRALVAFVERGEHAR
jgi:hypothetical protein